MLEQEIAKLRGQAPLQAELTFDQGGSIPAFYIPQDSVRVTLYRRLLRTSDLREIAGLRREVEDRFGPLPEQVRYLIDLTAIRNCGGKSGLRSVSVTRRETKVKGDMKTIAASLKGKRGWTILGDNALGPGGPGGVRTLVEAMNASA
jgi:transcription-repair coupling factor (superfamily II helicase)